MATAMAQLNVRMEPELKAAGDAILARVGVSPTQIVRALWLKLSRGIPAYEQVIATLAQEPCAADAAPAQEAAYPSFYDRLEAFYRDELGINPDTYAPPTEEEIEEFEMEERRAWERERLVGYAE